MNDKVTLDETIDVARPRHGETRSTAVALKADGNPEGKGLSGILNDWQQSRPQGVVSKPRRQILAEFFTSMLVLSAKFKYRPVVGKPNYLYWINGEWLLSLVSPQEWSAERRASFAGTCVLQLDRTWTIAPSRLLAEKNAVSAAIASFYKAFTEIMNTDLALEDILPVYVGTMPYYQRLNASALSSSLRETMMRGNQLSISGRSWQSQLPQLNHMITNDLV